MRLRRVPSPFTISPPASPSPSPITSSRPPSAAPATPSTPPRSTPPESPPAASPNRCPTSSGSTATTTTSKPASPATCLPSPILPPTQRSDSPPREDVRRHSFPGANFFMQDLLGEHHDELAVTASPAELTSASTETRSYLQSQAARLSLSALAVANGHLSFTVTVQNLTGHKLPTAFPSRRAWLHVTVADCLRPRRLRVRSSQRRRLHRGQPQ